MKLRDFDKILMGCTALLALGFVGCAEADEGFTASDSFESYRQRVSVSAFSENENIPKANRLTNKAKPYCDLIKMYSTYDETIEPMNARWDKSRFTVSNFEVSSSGDVFTNSDVHINLVLSVQDQFSRILDKEFIFTHAPKRNPRDVYFSDINIVHYSYSKTRLDDMGPHIYLFASDAHFGIPVDAVDNSRRHLSPRQIQQDVVRGWIYHMRRTEKIHHAFCFIPIELEEERGAGSRKLWVEECFFRSMGYPGLIEESPTEALGFTHFHYRSLSDPRPKVSDTLKLFKFCEGVKDE